VIAALFFQCETSVVQRLGEWWCPGRLLDWMRPTKF